MVDILLILIIINKKNIGAGASRNKGINKAKGKYIAFIDSDDFWKPNKLQQQFEFIKSNKYKFIDNLLSYRFFCKQYGTYYEPLLNYYTTESKPYAHFGFYQSIFHIFSYT